jgi:hypothetical protein
MYDAMHIDMYLDLLICRLPGEDLQAAVARKLATQAGILWMITQALLPWRTGNGLEACRIFLPCGTSVRHVCAKCGSTICASIVRQGVELNEGEFRSSLECAKYSAIGQLGCNCRRRSGRAVFYGRRVLDFWEVKYRDRWVRLSAFKMPWD